jgi:hypothetical protein
MRQRMLHEYLGKLLLAPDEFMHKIGRLLNGARKRQLMAIGIGHVEISFTP